MGLTFGRTGVSPMSVTLNVRNFRLTRHAEIDTPPRGYPLDEPSAIGTNI